ncbi:hypothetical protein [Vibrio phage Va2]|nr:hypothetical protein [Vibrio phage Va2]
MTTPLLSCAVVVSTKEGADEVIETLSPVSGIDALRSETHKWIDKEGYSIIHYNLPYKESHRVVLSENSFEDVTIYCDRCCRVDEGFLCTLKEFEDKYIRQYH